MAIEPMTSELLAESLTDSAIWAGLNLKTKMFRYFTCEYDSLRARSRSIMMAPSEVNVDNENIVRARLYPVKPKLYRWKYAVGDRIRISIQHQPFRKGYLGDWSEEIFEIASRLPILPVTYELRDLLGESVKGRFYEPDIQSVKV